MSIITEMYQGRAFCTFNEKAHTYHFRVPGVVEKCWQPSITGILAMEAKPALIAWSAKQSLKVVQRRLGEYQSEMGELTAVQPQELENWIADASENWREEDSSLTIGSVAHRYAFEELRFRKGLTLARPRFPIEADPVLLPNFTTGMLEATNAAASQVVKFFDAHHFEPFLLERPLWCPAEGYCGTEDFCGFMDGELVMADYKSSRKIYASYWCQLAALQNAFECEFPDKKIKKRVAVNIPKDGSDLQVEIRDLDERYEEDLAMFRACKTIYTWSRKNDEYKMGEPVRVLGNIFQQQTITSAQPDSVVPAQREEITDDRPW